VVVPDDGVLVPVVYDQSPDPFVVTETFVPSVPLISTVQSLRPGSPASRCPFLFSSRYFVPLRTRWMRGTPCLTLNASYLQSLGSTGYPAPSEQIAMMYTPPGFVVSAYGKRRISGIVAVCVPA
jgi:hypothetical protein